MSPRGVRAMIDDKHGPATALYDPLNYENLARSIVRALLDRALEALAPDPFRGPGVYAIYYRGGLDYSHGSHEKTPIYVGKAVPPGSRTGTPRANVLQDRSLHRRLREHEKSVTQAENLSIGLARCRFLAVVPVWITLAERFLLDHYRPIWNTVLDGFGNHDPGRGRRGSARSRWDIVHPGRPWAARLRARETPDEVIAEVLRRLDQGS